MKFIFYFFYISFDRGIRVDHEYVFFVFFENLFRVEKFKINESGQKPKKQGFGEMAVVFSRWISIYEQNALIFEISVKN